MVEIVDDLEKIIAQLHIFQSLSADEVHRLAQVVHLFEVSDGCILLEEGEIGDRFYVIVDGKVEVIKAMGTAEESRLGARAPGDFLGEMSLLNWDGRRTASAIAFGQVTLIEITRNQFDDLLTHHPGLVYEMVREMSNRLANSQAQAIQVLHDKNQQLQKAYDKLKTAQVQLIEKEKLERELQLAREIQLSILPRKLPNKKGYDLGALIVAAQAVGGDFFDIFPLDRNHLGIVIGDVTDKGVPAAIYMAQTRALLRAKASPDLSPVQTLRLVNDLLLKTNDSGMFVTVLYGSLNLPTGDLQYARAGHETPLLLRSSGETAVLPFKTGVPLGIIDRPLIDESHITIQAGELLLLYTDGVTDGLNLSTDATGTQGLQRIMSAAIDLEAQDFCTNISQTIHKLQEGKPQFDDVTLLAIRRKY